MFLDGTDFSWDYVLHTVMCVESLGYCPYPVHLTRCVDPALLAKLKVMCESPNLPFHL
jgi:hypothetical protein